MILDLQNLLSDKQDLAQTAGTYVSTNTIDTGVAGTPAIGGPLAHDVGRGGTPDVVVQITETFTSGGAATLQVQLISSANANLSSPTVLASSAAIALATLVAGYRFRLSRFPAGIAQRYIGVQYVIGTATTTAGKCTAGLTWNAPTSPGSLS